LLFVALQKALLRAQTMTLSSPAQVRATHWLSWLLGLATLVIVVVIALHASSAREFVRLAERAELSWLGFAVVLQAGTYWGQAEVFKTVARGVRLKLPVSSVYRLGFTKLFIDQALPSAGISGTIVLAKGLEERGVPRGLVAAAVIVDLVSYYAAYVLSVVAALVIVAVRQQASFVIVLTGLAFALFALAFSALALLLSGRRMRASHFTRSRYLETVLEFIEGADAQVTRKPRLLLEAGFFQLLIVLFDAATVWVLIRSLGDRAPVDGVFASFMISSLLRTIGILPGGLGTFEATSVQTLNLVGVGVPVALSATLLFRGLSFWLPLLPGLWFSRSAVSWRSPPLPDSSTVLAPVPEAPPR
jgi:Mg2+-importing ATPase